MNAAVRIPRAGLMTIARLRELYDAGMADFEGCGHSNQRTAKCRVCLTELPPCSGFGYNEFMTDGYRFQTRYVCATCRNALDAAAPEGSKAP